MMYVPERKNKKEDYSLSLNSYIEEKIKKDIRMELQERFKKEHLVENGKLVEALKKIKLSQINRFYSLLEDSTSLSNEDIRIFVEKQLDRAMLAKEDDDLKSAKDFYEYYQIHFLEIGNNVSEKNNMEHLIALEMIKDYVKYYNGIKKIEETLVNFKKKEEGN